MCSKAESTGTDQPLRVDAVHSHKTQLFFYARHGVISLNLRTLTLRLARAQIHLLLKGIMKG